jgi:hypothetical protein
MLLMCDPTHSRLPSLVLSMSPLCVSSCLSPLSPLQLEAMEELRASLRRAEAANTELNDRVLELEREAAKVAPLRAALAETRDGRAQAVREREGQNEGDERDADRQTWDVSRAGWAESLRAAAGLGLKSHRRCVHLTVARTRAFPLSHRLRFCASVEGCLEFKSQFQPPLPTPPLSILPSPLLRRRSSRSLSWSSPSPRRRRRPQSIGLPSTPLWLQAPAQQRAQPRLGPSAAALARSRAGAAALQTCLSPPASLRWRL